MMPRKKKERTIWQHRLNLSSDNPLDVRVHEHLLLLVEDGLAAKWIRDTLHNAVQSMAQPIVPTVVPTYGVDPTPERVAVINKAAFFRPETGVVNGRSFNPVPKPTFGKKSRKPKLDSTGRVADDEADDAQYIDVQD